MGCSGGDSRCTALAYFHAAALHGRAGHYDAMVPYASTGHDQYPQWGPGHSRSGHWRRTGSVDPLQAQENVFPYLGGYCCSWSGIGTGDRPLGKFFNQELYGKPTNLPWKIYIDPLHRVPGYENNDYFHPLFFYESFWNVLIMALLLLAARRFEKWLKPGDIFLAYMILYAIGRFSLEFLRLDASQVGGINFNQTFMVVVALVAGVILFLNHRLRQAKSQ